MYCLTCLIDKYIDFYNTQISWMSCRFFLRQIAVSVIRYFEQCNRHRLSFLRRVLQMADERSISKCTLVVIILSSITLVWAMMVLQELWGLKVYREPTITTAANISAIVCDWFIIACLAVKQLAHAQSKAMFIIIPIINMIAGIMTMFFSSRPEDEYKGDVRHHWSHLSNAELAGSLMLVYMFQFTPIAEAYKLKAMVTASRYQQPTSVELRLQTSNRMNTPQHSVLAIGPFDGHEESD